MSIPVARERSLLSPAEFEVVKATHHPAISSLSLEALRSAKRDLSETGEKLRARLVEERRARVRRTAREASPSTEPPLARRKQVFAKALRRLNHELHRREEAAAKVRAAPAGARAEPQSKKAPVTAVDSPPKAASDAKPARVPRTKKAGDTKREPKGRKTTAKQEG